jgi:hypothetical protein
MLVNELEEVVVLGIFYVVLAGVIAHAKETIHILVGTVLLEKLF